MTKKPKAGGIITLAILVAFSFVAAPMTSAKIENDLKKNTKNADVTELQNLLKEEGTFSKNVISTGFFGPITEKAVKDFQKKNGLPETGVVDKATRDRLNKEPQAKDAEKTANTDQAAKPAPANEPAVDAEDENENEAEAGMEADADMAAANAHIQELMNMIKVLQARLADAQAELAKNDAAPVQAVPADTEAAPAAPQDPAVDTPKGTEADDVAKPAKGTVHVGTPEQLAAGVFIHGGISGPGYPTGPLNLTLPASTLLFDRAGTGSLNGELKDRQYEAPLETVPPTMGSFPFTFNGVANSATSLKVISNLKSKNGVSQHTGTIDADVDTGPNLGHLTLAYNGTATVTGSTVTSSGVFKTTGGTGIFAGLVAEGTYTMTITESAATPGAPVTVTLTTVAP